MDVDRLAFGGALVGEDLEAVDELHDPVGLVADEPRQGPLRVGQLGLQQLRGAADARQRVLDLVRQHRAERRHGAGCPSMRQLPVHLVGNCTFLQHHDDIFAIRNQRNGVHVDNPLQPDPGRADVDPVLVDARCCAGAHPR